MTLKNRIAQLEKQAPRGDQSPQLIDAVMWDRSMQTLADALTDITGQATTPEEVIGILNHG